MTTKKTIAVLSDTGENARDLIDRLSKELYRFLVVKKEGEKHWEFWVKKGSSFDIEYLDCMKDSCWEADVVIMDFDSIENLKCAGSKIKEVATQKLVVSFNMNSERRENEIEEILSAALPDSKIVIASRFNSLEEFRLTGSYSDAIKVASELFENAGYRTRWIFNEEIFSINNK
jgi:hypothetical protein